MNSKDALELIFDREIFYKRLHYLALSALALCLMVIAVLLSIIIFLQRNPTAPLYFATNSIGRLIPIIPTNVPNMTTEEVIAWTIEAIQAAYSFDYVNYPAQLQSAQRYFTSYGWREYMKALTASNNLVGVRERRLIAIARVVQKPRITAQGLLSGAYAWKFEIPLLITYMQPPYDDQSSYNIPLTVAIIVQRQPILQSYKGLAILQSIGLPATTPLTPQSM